MVFRKKHERKAQKDRDAAKKNLKRARTSGDPAAIQEAADRSGRTSRRLKRIQKDTRETDK